MQNQSKRHQVIYTYEVAAASSKAGVKPSSKSRVQSIWRWLMTYFQDVPPEKHWADEHR